MKSKKLKQLLELLKEELIVTNSENQTGICWCITIMLIKDKISSEENHLLREYITLNKPKLNNQYAEFINNEFWTNTLDVNNSSYWWTTIKRDNLTKQIRIDYLTALINNIK